MSFGRIMSLQDSDVLYLLERTDLLYLKWLAGELLIKGRSKMRSRELVKSIIDATPDADYADLAYKLVVHDEHRSLRARLRRVNTKTREFFNHHMIGERTCLCIESFNNRILLDIFNDEARGVIEPCVYRENDWVNERVQILEHLISLPHAKEILRNTDWTALYKRHYRTH